MLKIIEGQIIPLSPNSRQRLWFECDCGNKKQIVWRNYQSHHTKTCGFCRSIKFMPKFLLGKKFGKLTLDPKEFPEKTTTKTKVKWLCECGGIRICEIGSVVNGYTKSCGCIISQNYKPPVKSVAKTKEEWLKITPELVNKNLPDNWSEHSSVVLNFKCKCGRIFERRFCKFKRNISTCMHCFDLPFTEMLGKRFGKLTFIDNRYEFVRTKSQQLYLFKCDCGSEKMINIGYVMRGYVSSCGNCNLINNKELVGTKFGNLTILSVPDKILKKHSEDFIDCRCDCGMVKKVRLHDILIKHTQSCGHCIETVKKWWDGKKNFIFNNTLSINNKYSLEYLSKYFSGSLLEPLEGCKNTNQYIRFRCKKCNTEFNTKLTWVWHHKICSCGCIKGSVSKECLEVVEFIKSLGCECQYGKNEFKIGPYKYDILVNKMIIEYNGLWYHRDKQSDYLKYQLLNDAYLYLMIYSDEWREKRLIFKNIIKQKLLLNVVKYKIRPQQCIIKIIPTSIANTLYNKFHYIGPVNKSNFNIGVFFKDILIACMSIRKPVRQNCNADWEISRMVSDFDYRIYGLWSYLLNWLKTNLPITGKIITFSDNRITGGKTYLKMGFVKDGEVKPDYYWSNRHIRLNKSTMRKTEEERKSGLTETELRTKQGYFRVWDLGKIRWSYCLT